MMSTTLPLSSTSMFCKREETLMVVLRASPSHNRGGRGEMGGCRSTPHPVSSRTPRPAPPLEVALCYRMYTDVQQFMLTSSHSNRPRNELLVDVDATSFGWLARYELLSHRQFRSPEDPDWAPFAVSPLSSVANYLIYADMRLCTFR